MIKIKQAVIVEGKYDKIKLDSLIDAIIIPTNGFEIFKDSKKMELIRALAAQDGIIIMTDSDSAGFIIRSYLSGSISNGKVYHAYIPDVLGKESRKTDYSKEGKLGVEGISSRILIEVLNRAGVVYEETASGVESPIDRVRLYEDGLIGGGNSRILRTELLKELGLPERLNTNSLVKVINSGVTQKQYESALMRARQKLESISERSL